mgnify:CR=1 FL=1
MVKLPFPPRGSNPILDSLSMSQELPVSVSLASARQDVPDVLGSTDELAYGIEEIINLILSRKYPEMENDILGGLDEEIFRQLGSAVHVGGGGVPRGVEDIISSSDTSLRLAPEDFDKLFSARSKYLDSGYGDSEYPAMLSELSAFAGRGGKDTYGHAKIADLLAGIDNLRRLPDESNLEPLLRYIMQESDSLLSDQPLGGTPGGLERYLNNLLTKATPMENPSENMEFVGKLPMDGRIDQIDKTITAKNTPQQFSVASDDFPPQDPDRVAMEMVSATDESSLNEMSDAEKRMAAIAQLMQMMGFNPKDIPF